MSPEQPTLEAEELPGRRFVRATRTAGITGLGTALPERRVSSEEIGARLGVSAEWIERRTGIRERRHAAPGERVSDLAATAGRVALEDAGLEAAELDMVLVATLASERSRPPPHRSWPATWARSTPPRSSVGAACSGSLAGLAHAASWIESGRARHVLVIGAEILTRFVDLDDRRTAPLFGDGAGAMVVSLDSGGEIGPFVFGSDGARADASGQPCPGVIEMEGHETFLQAVHRLSTSTVEVLELAGLALADIDLFVYHQANSRILTAVAVASGSRRSGCSMHRRARQHQCGERFHRAWRGGRWRRAETWSTHRARRDRRRPQLGRHRDDLGGTVSAASEHEGCALVTGASRGIGAAIACALAADGWPIGVNFKNDESAATATVERIKAAGGRAVAVRADVTDAEQVERLFATVEGEFGKVLVLVNNAGVRSDDLAGVAGRYRMG